MLYSRILILVLESHWLIFELSDSKYQIAMKLHGHSRERDTTNDDLTRCLPYSPLVKVNASRLHRNVYVYTSSDIDIILNGIGILFK